MRPPPASGSAVPVVRSLRSLIAGSCLFALSTVPHAQDAGPRRCVTPAIGGVRHITALSHRSGRRHLVFVQCGSTQQHGRQSCSKRRSPWPAPPGGSGVMSSMCSVPRGTRSSRSPGRPASMSSPGTASPMRSRAPTPSSTSPPGRAPSSGPPPNSSPPPPGTCSRRASGPAWPGTWSFRSSGSRSPPAATGRPSSPTSRPCWPARCPRGSCASRSSTSSSACSWTWAGRAT